MARIFFPLLLLSLPCPESLGAQDHLYTGHTAPSGEAGEIETPHRAIQGGGWEGMAEAVAYSEFNHRFVGILVLLFGLAEFGPVVRQAGPLWIRLILPGALGIVSIFLLIWSDHDAWPIGSLGFTETFSGEDREILQHKLYGAMAGIAALCETLRRIGWGRHPAWSAPVIFYGVIGGVLLLFLHSHGDHPSQGRIDLHHAVLGSLGIAAALSRAVAVWVVDSASRSRKVWELLWGGFVIAMGIQLLVYDE